MTDLTQTLIFTFIVIVTIFKATNTVRSVTDFILREFREGCLFSGENGDIFLRKTINYVHLVHRLNVNVFGNRLFTVKSFKISFLFSLFFFTASLIVAFGSNLIFNNGRLYSDVASTFIGRISYSVLIFLPFVALMFTIDWICCEKSRFLLRKVRLSHGYTKLLATFITDLILSTFVFIINAAFYVTVVSSFSYKFQLSDAKINHKTLLDSYECYAESGLEQKSSNTDSYYIFSDQNPNSQFKFRYVNRIEVKRTTGSRCVISHPSMVSLACAQILDDVFVGPDLSISYYESGGDLRCSRLSIPHNERSDIIFLSTLTEINNNRVYAFYQLVYTYLRITLNHILYFPNYYAYPAIDHLYNQEHNEVYEGEIGRNIHRIAFPFTSFIVSTYLTSIWMLAVIIVLFVAKSVILMHTSKSRAIKNLELIENIFGKTSRFISVLSLFVIVLIFLSVCPVIFLLKLILEYAIM